RNSGGGFDSLETFLADLQRQDPARPVELWCEDEARLGLQPVTRRVWALKGTRPARSGRPRYQALYVYGFCQPASGRNLCLFLPKANTELMGEALAEFARWADPFLKESVKLKRFSLRWLRNGSAGRTSRLLRVRWAR